MPKKDRVGQVYIDAAVQQAAALGMTQEELARSLAEIDPNAISFFDPERGHNSNIMEEYKTFVTVWPNYIDATKTIPEGRRIPKAEACPKPDVQDISEVLQSLGIRHVIEPHKRYPRVRDAFVHGRVKVELKDKDGDPLHPEVPNRRALLLELGKQCPLLKSRQIRLASDDAARKAQQVGAAKAAEAAALSGGGASGGGGAARSNKKKGKKKGKR